MAKSKTINDRIFGQLTNRGGDLWTRPIELHIFGKVWTVDLTVDIDPKGGLERNQIEAYGIFVAHTKAIVSASEKAIFHHYQSVCSDYRARLGAVAADDARVPIIRSTREVFPLVKPEGVTFPYVRRTPTFGILCQCSWEIEHGLGVKIENGNMAGVGFQDIVL